MKVGGIITKLPTLADADVGSGPIVVNFPTFTRDYLTDKKMMILSVPGLAIRCDVDATNEKIEIIFLSAKVSENASYDAPAHELTTKLCYQNVFSSMR